MSFNYCFNLGELTQFAGKLQPRSLRFLLIVSLSVGLNPAGSGSGVFLIGDTAAPTKDPISVKGTLFGSPLGAAPTVAVTDSLSTAPY